MSAALDGWLELYAPPHQQPGDKTLKDAAEAWGVGLGKARRMLDELVMSGELITLPDVVLASGKRGRVWRPAKPPRKAVKKPDG